MRRIEVSNLSATTDLDGNPVTLNWSAPDGVSFDSSKSWYIIHKGGSFINIVPATEFSYEDTAVKRNHTYTYTVYLAYPST